MPLRDRRSGSQPLARLARPARLNPTTGFLAGVVFVLVALFAPGLVGGVLLLALVLALGTLAVYTMPVARPATRILRLAMLALLLAVALTKIF